MYTTSFVSAASLNSRGVSPFYFTCVWILRILGLDTMLFMRVSSNHKSLEEHFVLHIFMAATDAMQVEEVVTVPLGWQLNVVDQA